MLELPPRSFYGEYYRTLHPSCKDAIFFLVVAQALSLSLQRYYYSTYDIVPHDPIADRGGFYYHT
jgi:hypothetical protein